ncbi:MAG: hypothetical protein QOK39_945 [Acidimicrobiaceae bacterium]|nr:hypothetical protein [Acidimicrobiaceae bacterium]
MRWQAGTPKLCAILATFAASALALCACSSAKHATAPTSGSTTTTVAPFPFDLGTTTTTAGTGANSTSSTAIPTTTTAPTSTVAPNPGRVCAPTELAVTATTDRTTYTAGQTVTVAISIRSRSTTECTLDRRAAVNIVDPAGKVVVGGQQFVDRFVGAGGAIRPTQSFTLTFTWDQVGCSGAGGRCLAGQYTAAASLGEIQLPVHFNLA